MRMGLNMGLNRPTAVTGSSYSFVGDGAGNSTSTPTVSSISGAIEIASIETLSDTCAMSATRIALVQSGSTDTLGAYDWDGSDLSLVGNALSITNLAVPHVVCIDTNVVAVFNDTANTIQAYTFDGTDWSATGSALSVTGNTYSSMSALDQNKILYAEGVGTTTIQAYSFSGSSWSTLGNSLSGVGANHKSVACMTATRCAVLDPSGDDLIAYDFDGSDWAQVGNALGSLALTPGFWGVAALASDRVIFHDDANHTIKIYDFDGTDWSSVFSGTGTGVAATSWPRKISRFSDTEVFINSYGDANLRLVTLAT